jgi:hypothetical protein
MRFTAAIMLILSVSASVLVGCATSDYGRITNKIAEYEVRDAKTEQTLKGTQDRAIQLQCLNSLIQSTETQLKLAKRINPSSNPGVRKGEITYEAAKAEANSRIEALENRLREYRKQRAALGTGT